TARQLEQALGELLYRAGALDGRARRTGRRFRAQRPFDRLHLRSELVGEERHEGLRLGVRPRQSRELLAEHRFVQTEGKWRGGHFVLLLRRKLRIAQWQAGAPLSVAPAGRFRACRLASSE